MSRNNLIIVANLKDYENLMRYYIFLNINADTQWDKDYIRNIINKQPDSFIRDRGEALVYAHDKQLELETEYGVQEMFLE